MPHRPDAGALVLLAALALAPPVAAQDSLQATPLRGGLHLLAGPGGNVVASTGPDGIFLVDDNYAPMTPALLRTLAAIAPGPVRFVINTHWHPDHTEGNEALGEAGAIVVAHHNVRTRMSAEQFHQLWDRRMAPAAPGALPVVTFGHDATLHVNGDTVRAMHVPAAHTDGDAIIHFPAANVIHAGDVYWNGMYPFIDIYTGGSIDGTIEAVRHMLGVADAETTIVPGHGPPSDRTALAAYLAMLIASRDRVLAVLLDGKTRDEAIAARPTASLDPVWGRGFIRPDDWVWLVYESLVADDE